MVYPLVEYAHKIGKNTAEFTAADMSNFTKWWIKQPQSAEIIKWIKDRQKRAEQVGDMLQANKKEDRAMVEGTLAQQEQYNQDVISMKQWLKGESMSKDGKIEQEEVVCSIELTKTDVAALLFSISRTFEDYDMDGHEYGTSLSGLKEGLEGV